MLKVLIGLVVAAVLVLPAEAQPSCVFPSATSKAVALGIFKAIAHGRQPPKRSGHFVINIEDAGENWLVYQTVKNGDSVKTFVGKDGRAWESVKVTTGGGGLEMTINKCTAVVSDVHLSR
jgi:hypothetical protein